MKVSFKELIELEPKPKKVKAFGSEFEYSDSQKMYFEIGDNKYMLTDYFDIDEMKDQTVIKILDEKKEIEKLDYKYVNLYGNNSTHKHSEFNIIDKVNEIIDKLNEMEKREK